MKRFSLTLLFRALVMTLGVSASWAGIESDSKDLGAIWFIGDSITQSNADGSDVSSPRLALYELLTENGYDFSFTGHFAANVDGLPESGASVEDNLYHYHSGVSGYLIGELGGQRGIADNLSAYWGSGRLATVKPNVVLIMIGTNDVGRFHSLENAPSRLNTLVQMIYDLPGVGSPTLFLASIPPNGRSAEQMAHVVAFNEKVPDIVAEFAAKGRDIHFVDQFPPLNDDYSNVMRADNLHPNAVGNNVMAQTWFEAVSSRVASTESEWSGGLSDYHGYDLYSFSEDGLNCKVAVPEIVAEGRPWVWRARFWGHNPDPDVALLKEGFHVAYVDVSNLFGSPAAVERFDRFYEFLTNEHGFDKRVVLEGLSRGGLIVYNWGSQNTGKVHCIYADAPVCDIKSWPAGLLGGKESVAAWKRCLEAYGFSLEEAVAYTGNPLDRLKPLADAGVPLLHVVGDADLVVPVAENTAVLEQRYKALGGSIEVIHKPGVGHVHGLDDPTPIVDFILRNVRGE